MKVRIGFGLGTHTTANEAGSFGALVDALEGLRFDSLWLSERLTGDAPDPLTALAFAAGRTERLKLGTSVLVLPGRNPVVLAKEMASLDRLSGGRFLPALGLGAVTPVGHRAFGVQRADRSGWFDEAIGLLRRLWTEDHVTHDGERFQLEDITLRPRPIQQPIDLWLGGQAPSELRRVGRLGDGWLPSFCTVDDVAEGWPVIVEVAAAHDRTIDPEHLGVLLAWTRTEVPDRVRALLGRRRPELDPTEVVPVGLDAMRERLEAFIAVGASKFVLLPLDEPSDWEQELGELADAVGDLQT
jgi:probable F420-dependent oxidoreductase